MLHLLLTSDLDLDAWRTRSESDEQPHHLMGEIRDAFGAMTHPPSTDTTLLDRALALLCDTPEQWASARQVSRRLGAGDVVFSVSEDMTLPLLFWLQVRRKRATVVTSVMNPGRIRMKVLFRAFNARRRVARFVALTPVVERILVEELGIPSSKVERFPMETDFDFFRPVARERFRERPLVFSAGLEQRDYTTLAEATAELDVEVEVCAKSPDASSRTRTAVPDRLPPNMRFHPYEWVDYRRMFSEADVIVVSVLPNRYGAGLTTVMEGLATGRPVIVTDQDGLPGELAAAGLLHTVPTQDPTALREAIEKVLADPTASEEFGRRARVGALERFRTECAIRTLDRIIQDVAPGAATRSPEPTTR